MKIAVYLSAIPAKTKNEFKKNLLMKFAVGAKAVGDDVLLVDNVNTIQDADIAVLQGWIGMKSAPHLDQRQRVIRSQARMRKHTLVIDSNLFGFMDPQDRDRYLRYSLDGIFPTSGYYFDRNIDPSRWEEIKYAYGWQERPWNLNGKCVLICLQRDGGWSMDGLGIMDWLSTIIPQIQAVSHRPIVIRPHPGSLKVIPEVRQRWPNIEVSTGNDIRQDLDRSWCSVTYNSSPGVASLLWGVPTFVTDPHSERSQAYACANTDLTRIDDPARPDRTQWYYRLAQCHFATSTLENGEAWRFMRQRLPNT